MEKAKKLYFPISDKELTYRTVLFEKFEPFVATNGYTSSQLSCYINDVEIFYDKGGVRIEDGIVQAEPIIGKKERLFYKVYPTLLKTDSEIISVLVKRIHYFNGKK